MRDMEPNCRAVTQADINGERQHGESRRRCQRREHERPMFPIIPAHADKEWIEKEAARRQGERDPVPAAQQARVTDLRVLGINRVNPLQTKAWARDESAPYRLELYWLTQLRRDAWKERCPSQGGSAAGM